MAVFFRAVTRIRSIRTAGAGDAAERELARTVEEYKSTVEQMEARYQRESRTLSSEIQSLKQKHFETESRARGLEAELGELRARLARLVRAEEERHATKLQLDGVSAELAAARMQLADAQKALNAKHAEATRLEDDVGAKEKRYVNGCARVHARVLALQRASHCCLPFTSPCVRSGLQPCGNEEAIV